LPFLPTLTGEMGSFGCFFFGFIGSIGGCGLNLGTCEEGNWRWRTKPKKVNDLNLEINQQR